MERLVDPAIADLQADYGDARRRGAIWSARRVLLVGRLAVIKVLTLAAVIELGDVVRYPTATECAIYWRALRAFMTASIVATMIFIAQNHTHLDLTVKAPRTLFVLYLLPATLPLSVAAGVTFAVLWALRTERLTARIVGAMLAVALLCSVAMFVDVAWVVPESNQAYRELWAGKPVARGDHEMSLSELRRQIALRPDKKRRLALTYHQRWSISAAPLVLTTLGLAMVRFHCRKRTTLLLAGGICLTYWMMLFAATDAGIWTMMPVPIVAWSPNIASALLASGLAWRTRNT
ncbi:MAG TPA: LptF/LptG family permease [Vicinamibacterales bacterium]|nr:LptF/LptG family permease [Vicinamibacterales bacterium]